MTKRRVLIPIDNTDFSKEIFAQLEIVGQPAGLELVLLKVEHVVTQSFGVSPGYIHIDFDSFTTEERLRQSALAQIAPQAETLKKMGYSVRSEVGFGEPADQIVFYADRAKVDLIAMATHGRAGLSHFIRGSVAESVLHSANVPVLLFRPVEKQSSGLEAARGKEHHSELTI